MKKIHLLMLSVLCMLLIVSCEQGAGKTNTDVNEETSYFPNKSTTSTVDLDNIDDLVKYASHIVYGTVIDVTPFSAGTSEYFVQVHEEFKSELDAKEIYVYEPDGTLEIGESYILFLSEFIGGFFPHPTYTSINKEVILQGNKNSLVETIEDIANSPNLSSHPETNRELVLLNNASLHEVTTDADIIAEVTPTIFTTENKYMKIAEVEVLNNHKGQLESGATIHFPASVELNKDYLVYLKDESGMLIVNSIDIGVIDLSDQELWEEAMQILENK